MKINKKLLFIPIFLICVLTISYFAHSYYSKKEFKQKINFLIAKVEVSPAARCRFYDKKGNQLNLNSYTFYKFQKIISNDSIAKNENSSKLKIYRQDKNGKYYVYLELEPD
ncbi:MAG: hypothetical protein RLY43_2412 [Bacteroidota bacterium]|jgi:hypothetical protein